MPFYAVDVSTVKILGSYNLQLHREIKVACRSNSCT